MGSIPGQESNLTCQAQPKSKTKTKYQFRCLKLHIGTQLCGLYCLGPQYWSASASLARAGQWDFLLQRIMRGPSIFYLETTGPLVLIFLYNQPMDGTERENGEVRPALNRWSPKVSHFLPLTFHWWEQHKDSPDECRKVENRLLTQKRKMQISVDTWRICKKIEQRDLKCAFITGKSKQCHCD